MSDVYRCKYCDIFVLLIINTIVPPLVYSARLAISILVVHSAFCNCILTPPHTHTRAHTQRRRRYQPLQGAAVVEKVERRLIFIPGFFLALRIWGTVQFFYSIGVSHHNDNGCIPKGIHIGFQILGYLQVRKKILIHNHVFQINTQLLFIQ